MGKDKKGGGGGGDKSGGKGKGGGGGDNKKGGGEKEAGGKAKGAQSINVRHILVRMPFRPGSILCCSWKR